MFKGAIFLIKASQSKWSFWTSKLTVYGRLFGHSSDQSVQIKDDSPSLWIFVHSDVPVPQFGLHPFGCTYAVVLDASKYTNTYCLFGQNSTIQMDTWTECIWTTKKYVIGPSVWTVNVILDRPNEQRSNGPSMLR